MLDTFLIPTRNIEHINGNIIALVNFIPHEVNLPKFAGGIHLIIEFGNVTHPLMLDTGTTMFS